MKNIHIGIIPDGNRRYAEKYNISKKLAYKKGYLLILDIIKYCIKNKELLYEKVNKLEIDELYNINELTIYVCSIDNLLKRDKDDVNNIYKLINKFIKFFDKNKDFIDKHKIQINIIGNLSIIDNNIVEKLENIVKLTKNNNIFTLNLAMAYSGREEIINNIKKLDLNKEIDEKTFYNYFDLKNDIDIVIRTGSEFRTSNFFPWQTIYSEWFFLQKLWGELNIDDFIQILIDYQNRNRRFGK